MPIFSCNLEIKIQTEYRNFQIKTSVSFRFYTEQHF
jgi:hypothetical protein